VAERHRSFHPAARFVFGATCQVIACSGDLARRVVELGMPEDRVKVVPYGADVERYATVHQSAPTLRTDLSILEDQQVVMVMGRLVYKKGFSYFLRAAPHVLAQCPGTIFVVAGEGDLRTELEELAKAMHIRENVLFTGHIGWDQTPKYLAMSDIFVVPSILDDAGNVDGLPNVLLESMASGCAVVASNVAGIPEVIDDGENGLLVAQRDEHALAEAICRLLNDPELRQRLGAAARATVVGSLSWTHVGDQVAHILHACVREHNR
jgi:glycosyltransferase involved in cell wall biosynthesis